MADQVSRVVPAGLDGERLDKVLAQVFGLSRSKARDLIERGVTLDGVPARPRDRVAEGATIGAPEPEVEETLKPEPVDFDVLYEDEDVIVVGKPAGLVAHPGAGSTTGTLAAGLLYRYPDIEGVGSPGRWGLVHRLDKDTSGTLVVVRTRQSHESLTTQLRKREIKRVYTTLVDGVPGSPTGTIDAPIGRDQASPLRRAVTREGKSARTHYEVMEAFIDRGCALLRVTLETGRTHQIRVHLSAIGHPVIGDRTYGKGGFQLTVPRTFLHATSVEFTHPRTGRHVGVEAPLPDDLAVVLEELRRPGRV